MNTKCQEQQGTKQWREGKGREARVRRPNMSEQRQNVSDKMKHTHMLS